LVYNIISCAGFVAGSGGCMKSKLGFVLLFFIIAILRKWGGEETEIQFSFLFALILSLFPYLIIVTILGSMKIAMITGLVGGVIGGYGAGRLFTGGDDFG
jgi:uncharacterized membrane protein|tara:strand:- start:1369 stop:1668 length:300 start_codon:yes stop_codon:yes gene_type:complete